MPFNQNRWQFIFVSGGLPVNYFTTKCNLGDGIRILCTRMLPEYFIRYRDLPYTK